MKRIESIEDQMNGVVTYELSNGKRLRIAKVALEYSSPAEILRRAGYGHLIPTERVPVMWAGRKAGTLPGDFDPVFIKSKTWLYDPRPGDFVREGEVWVASNKLGPGDLEAVPGFVWDRESLNSETSN